MLTVELFMRRKTIDGLDGNGYSKHTHFRWKIKWRLEHLGALGILDEIALAQTLNIFSPEWKSQSG